MTRIKIVSDEKGISGFIRSAISAEIKRLGIGRES